MKDSSACRHVLSAVPFMPLSISSLLFTFKLVLSLCFLLNRAKTDGDGDEIILKKESLRKNILENG